MKESVKKVYQCDHCNKKYFVKHACLSHEIKCAKNPQNIRACFNCKFLKMVDYENVEVHFESGGYDETRHEKVPTYYECSKLKQKVFFPKAEYLGLIDKYPEHFEDQDPMPMECEHFENIDYTELTDLPW